MMEEINNWQRGASEDLKTAEYNLRFKKLSRPPTIVREAGRGGRSGMSSGRGFRDSKT